MDREAAGMKYIANGKRHQQEIGARRWRPCLIKTNCRWAWIFILTENRLKLPSETLLQQSKSTSTHGRKKKEEKTKMIACTQTAQNAGESIPMYATQKPLLLT